MSATTKATHRLLWLSGSFVPADRAAISPLDRGFLYGDGVFETMRSEGGKILYLADHVARLLGSCAALRIHVHLPENLDEIVAELLRQNGLTRDTASVKILVSRGVCAGLGLPEKAAPTICLTAQSYRPPDPSSYHKGWRLHVFREGFSPPLAGHKTLNYLYFLMARQAALDEGADEAVILDHRGEISETSAGSILARTNGAWWTPASAYRLPSITLKHVCRILADEGRSVELRSAVLEDLLSAETVWVLNSLMGIMPASHLDGRPLPVPGSDEAGRLRKCLMERGKKVDRKD